MKNIISQIILLTLVICLVPAIIGADKKDRDAFTEKYKGHIVCLDAPGSKRDTRINLNIKKFSSDEEMAKLAHILKTEGQDKLLDTMWNMEGKGFVKIGNSLGYEVVVFRKIQTETGYIIRAITDRPIQMVETMRGLRSREFPFGIIEMTINTDGVNTGTMAAAAKAFFKDDKLKVELYGTRPCNILRVKKVEKKK